MPIGILNWQNEQSQSAYPLQPYANAINDLLVDASFIQFDGVVPVLNNILVSATDFLITLTCDAGILTFTFLRSTYEGGTRYLSMYSNVNGVDKRYLGRLVFGDGAMTLWNNFSNQNVAINASFVATTVRSIPSKDAVYSLEDRFGTIVFTRTALDNTIFYNTPTSGNFITFNAVGHHAFPTTELPPVLKLLNLLAPVNNNVYISGNDVIKIDASTQGSLTFSLVGSELSSAAPILPTLAS